MTNPVEIKYKWIIVMFKIQISFYNECQIPLIYTVALACLTAESSQWGLPKWRVKKKKTTALPPLKSKVCSSRTLLLKWAWNTIFFKTGSSVFLWAIWCSQIDQCITYMSNLLSGLHPTFPDLPPALIVLNSRPQSHASNMLQQPNITPLLWHIVLLGCKL